MSLIKRNNENFPVRTLMSDFFETDVPFFNDFFRTQREWGPAVNIMEKDKTFEIELVAPGLKKDDFKVKMHDGLLTISYEKKEEKEEKEKDYTRKEFSFTSFNRAFTLPENVKEEEIKAKYEEGILHLTLVKKAVSVTKAKEIQVL